MHKSTEPGDVDIRVQLIETMVVCMCTVEYILLVHNCEQLSIDSLCLDRSDIHVQMLEPVK